MDETNDSTTPMDLPRQHPLALRLIAAMSTAVCIFAITFECARRQYGGLISYYYGSGMEYHLVHRWQEKLDEYIKTSGREPSELAEVATIKEEAADVSGRVLDQWHNPYQLVHRDGRLIIVSYGPDRMLGGLGWNADVAGDQTRYPGPTLRQYLTSPAIPTVITVCLVTAVVAGLVLFSATKGFAPSWAAVIATSIAAIITGAIAVLVGVFMVGVNLSGH